MGKTTRFRLFTGVTLLVLVLVGSAVAAASVGQGPPRQMEYLDRGLVAVKVDEGVFLSWRMLGTDPDHVAFNLYRDGQLVNPTPIATSTNYVDPFGTVRSTYEVRPIINGTEQTATKRVGVWEQQYLEIPLQRPQGGTTPDGVSYTYSPNDGSVGDVDGDGEYEIILKWDPSNAKDNAHDGYTGNVYIDAYKLDGTMLWRIDLGKNVRAGAHYTQFMVYDLDGDGRAEVAMRTSDGTIDGVGNVIGDPNADYRDSRGRVLRGPEYFTIFDGETGRELVSVDFKPQRGSVNDWGDNYGNRSDRFLAAVAYLDGERPSVIMARGYYAKTVLTAYNFRDGKLTEVWTFDSHDPSRPQNRPYAGQGNHQLSVHDVDGDGRDEIIYGAAVIDDDGTGLYTTGWGHGDALHAGDLDPTRPGLEVFQVHESTSSPYGASFRDAATGEIIWGVRTGADTGRGMSSDIDPRYPGYESWASNRVGMHSAQGQFITGSTPSINFGIWWDGDLLRELLDNVYIDKWDWERARSVRLLTGTGVASNNGSKSTPVLSGDILGDWREEVIWRTADNAALRLYTTTDLTEHRIYTLMHDPAYRLAIAWQNVAYNQPPHPSFFLGHDMPPPPKPNIYLTAGEAAGVALVSPTREETMLGVSGDVVLAFAQTDPDINVQSVQVFIDGAEFASVAGLPDELVLDVRALGEGDRDMDVVIAAEGRDPIGIWRRLHIDNVSPSLSVFDSGGGTGIVQGQVHVAFEAVLADGLDLETVEVRWGDDVVYSGSGSRGEIALNSFGYADGLYNVTVAAKATNGTVDEARVEVELQNVVAQFVEPKNRAVLTHEVPLVLSVSTAEGLPLDEVLVQVDGETIYQSATAPDDLILGTRAWEDGLHTLAVIAKAGGREKRHEVEVSFVNRWRKYDHIKPPAEGWFGMVDRRETSSESDGWVYATDNPADFFDDEDRLTRQADTSEYLIWSALQLEEAIFTVYAKDPADVGKAVRVAISSDGETWTDVPVEIVDNGKSSAGWHQLDVVARNDEDLPTESVRFSIDPHGGAADGIQIGMAQFVGFRE